MLSKAKGFVFIFISAILYGSYGLWSVLLGSGFGTFYQGWVRAAVILMLITPFCFITKQWTPIKWSDLKHFTWSLGFLLFSQAPIYYAFQHAGVGITSVIFFGSYVVAAYIVGYFLLHERINTSKLTSIVLALIGLYLSFYGSLGTSSPFALVMGVLAGIAGGGGMSATKLVPKKFSSLQILVVTWGQSLIIHLPISILIGERQLIPSLDIHWAALVGFALAGIFASWFLVEGLKTVDSSIGGLISLLEVVVAIVFGYVIFNEKLYLAMIVGAGCIVLAAAIPSLVTIATNKKVS